MDTIELPPTADFHVHLRDGLMMETVTPLIKQGGVDTVFVMPNLQPPLTTPSAAISYRSRLQKLAPDVTFLMSLYLNDTVTPATIHEAANAGITGVKVYPSGVTTNSEHGVADLDQFYPVFAAMQEHDLVLNLHGEVAPKPGAGTSVLSAEEEFLPTLRKLHAAFPRLRIILEHCTTAAAIEAVKACDPGFVAATITAHHLYLTVDDWCGDGLNFCKPVAKTPADRDALVRAACSGDPRFFFGSDSAPHPLTAKQPAGRGKAAAGVFTQPYTTQLVVMALEEAVEKGVVEKSTVTQERLAGFLSDHGRRFYKLPPTDGRVKIILERGTEVIAPVVKSEDGSIEVAISRAGHPVRSLKWSHGS